jgi:hypothetical protein
VTPPQLTLFQDKEFSDKRPPLNIADRYGFDLQHYIREDGSILYSVQDWIAGVGKVENARRFWTDLKARAQKAGDELYASCVQLPYQASNGKTYKMDFANEETLYQITQRMDTNTGIRNDVLTYLSIAGVFAADVAEALANRENGSPVDQLKGGVKKLAKAKIQQGMTQSEALEFIQIAQEGKEKRKGWMAALKAAVRDSIRYDIATDTEYRELFGVSAKDIKQATGFDTARDGMTAAGRAFLTAAELSLEALFNQRDNLTFQDALAMTRELCRDFRIPIASVEKRLGISLATGQSLLSTHN